MSPLQGTALLPRLPANPSMPIAIEVVIVVIPVPIRVPAMLILVPPAMPTAPAPFPRLVQIMTRAFRLPALRAVMFNGFVELVIDARNSALAIVVGRKQSGRSAEHKKPAKRHCCQG
jgi:hypothetical protein